MVKRIVFSLIILILLLNSGSVIGQENTILPEPWPDANSIIPGRLVVKMRYDDQLEPLGLQLQDKIHSLGFSIYTFDVTQEKDPYFATIQKLVELSQLPSVQYVEFDYIARITETPNDERLSAQWGIHKIDAPEAWDIEKGNFNIAIAVVDTGVHCGHPDIGRKCVRGYDFVNRDDQPLDDHGHGTHVAGIAAAMTNNGVGIAGTCWECAIMPIKVMDNRGAGSHSTIAEGIVWAVDHGAKVINLSLGGTSPSQVMREAVQYAERNRVTVVAAAGNSGTNQPMYPAAYPETIAVAATDSSDRKTNWSNFGDWVNIAAPGAAILSTLMNNEYGYMSGTSMATPFVAGAAGLLIAQDPTRSPREILRLLSIGAEDINYRDVGAGRLNIARSLNPDSNLPTPTPYPTSQPPTPTPTPGQPEKAIAVVNEINRQRDRFGLPALNPDERLFNAALRHSADMATNSRCSHVGSDGSDPVTRMREAGYPVPYGETVGCGYRTAQDVVTAWIRSPAHRRILFCEICTDIGAAYAQGGTMRHYWTVNIGAAQDDNEPRPTPTPRPTLTPAPTPMPTPTPEPRQSITIHDMDQVDLLVSAVWLYLFDFPVESLNDSMTVRCDNYCSELKKIFEKKYRVD